MALLDSTDTMGVSNRHPIRNMAREKRFPIKLPPWHEKRLILWAEMKGTTKTTLGQNVLQARIEANEDQIESMLRDQAIERGLTVEQLKAEILDKNGYAPDDSDETD